jgi:PAS domain S-box-containing protein
MFRTDIDKGHHLTDILIRIARIAVSTGELREILESFARTIVESLHKDNCSICLFRQDKRVLCIEATADIGGCSISSYCLTMPLDEIMDKFIKGSQPVMIEEIKDEPSVKALLKDNAESYQSLLIIPIPKEDTIAGLLIIPSREHHIYTKEESHIFTLIAHHLSSAIRNAELYIDVKKQLDELKTIHEITKAITSILDIDKLLPFICEEVSKLFNVKGCIIRLIEGKDLVIKASYGIPEEAKEVMTLPIGEGIAGCVAKTGEILVIDDVSKKMTYEPMIATASIACLPLKIGDRIIGTLGLYDKKDEWSVTTFSQDDINMLKIFASVSSIAIENARLYKAEIEKEEKILSLYWDVTQTKDYLNSIIEHSADAIITSDIKGIITSWNKQAEKIYGYTEDEALGKFLPMVPDFLEKQEKEFIEKICNGETISNIETIRRRKDGKLIEVSLTLSPILDSSGKVTGISGISRDISEKKRIEKELLKRNKELSRLFFINSVIRNTLDLNKLLRMVLTVVTTGDGLGFNRAVLFLLNEEEKVLQGVMGVGPANAEEAAKIWNQLSREGKSLEQIIDDIERGTYKQDTFLDRISHTISIPLSEDCILTRCAMEKRPFNIRDAKSDPSVNPALIQELGVHSFGIVPLITRDKAIGLILVDNLFTGKPINDEDLKFLTELTSHIASAIENARLFESISLAEAELKHIFESISDMVFFTDKDFNIRRVNKAVIKKTGKTEKELIGEKCYKIFHGKDAPWEKCPHLQTIESRKPRVQEIEDSHLGGTFVVSNSPILDSMGNLLGTVHISRDITELHNLRERVEHAEKMAALGELAARVAHEIRNPLVSIGGFARRLEKRLSGDLHEYADIIVKEVERLENILKEILGFVKGSRPVKESVDINELINTTIDLISPSITERGNRIIKDFFDSPIMLKIDPDRIRDAILNIITNANQATENGTITIKTWIRYDEAVIEISDTGCGIKPNDRKNIFNPFFTTKPQGTGLGLAVTHKIIQEHDGRIHFETICEEEKDEAKGIKCGTTFKIYLPLSDSSPSLADLTGPNDSLGEKEDD